MIKFRVKKVKHKNLTVGTTIFNDDRVSLFARGLFCTALALAQNEDCEMKRLIASVPDDADKVYKGVMELRKLGYCKRVTIDGEAEFQFRETPSRKASRVKNKEPLLYSKEVAQEGLRAEPAPKQIREDAHEEDPFEDWDEIDPQAGTVEVGQPSFLPDKLSKKSRPAAETVPAVAHRIMQRICFLVETETEALTLTASDRGRIASALGKLRDIGADLGKLNHFEGYWTSTWRSKDKGGAYQPPTPEQVVQFWVQATKHGSYKPTPVAQKPAQHIEVDLTAMMKNRAALRKQ